MEHAGKTGLMRNHETHPNSKYSNEFYKEIQEKFSTGKFTQRELINQYGISRGGMYHITKRMKLC
jgi:hypothetical protein